MQTPKKRRYPVAVVWQDLLGETFSTLGRMELLTGCRAPRTGRYWHAELASEFGEQPADDALRTIHELIWRDWMRSSLEQQHADLLLYVNTVSDDKPGTLKKWAQNPPVLALVPECAEEPQRGLFAQNLKSLATALRTRYEPPPFETAGDRLQAAISTVCSRYGDPELSLGLLSKATCLSERHLTRMLRQRFGKSFLQFLRETRIAAAAELLVQSSYDIKKIAGMVGYRYSSRFGSDFRLLMNCTPTQFRKNHAGQDPRGARLLAGF